MRQTLFLIFLLFPFRILAQQDVAPVIGVSDRRVDVYGLKNARVVVDYQTTLENTDILISNGRIESIGTKLAFPKGTIIYDLTGKTVYPSFIDVYAGNYGIKTQAGGADANPFDALMNPAQTGRTATTSTSEARIADYWNDGINASYNVIREFIPDLRLAGEYRQTGFGAVVTFKADGIARGTSSLVTTGDGKANNLIIKNKASANYTFTQGRSADLYPTAQYGTIALLRQLFNDAQWYKQLPEGYFHDEGVEAFNNNLSLPQIFEVTDKLEIMRIDKIGKEFGITYIIKGSGNEYQTISDIKKAGNKLIIPINYPEAPDVKDPYDAASVTYSRLKHYELAPSNLAKLSGAGLTFAITSSDLRRRSDFLTNLRKAVKYGLSENEALKALTFTPATLIGVSDLVGAVKKNMLANLLVTSGNIFKDDCIIYENWVEGTPYRLTDLRIKDLRGTYSIKVDIAVYKLVLSGAIDKPGVKLTYDSTEIRGATFSQEKDLVSLTFEISKLRYRLSGYIVSSGIEGKGQLDNGKWISWKADYSGPASQSNNPQKKSAVIPEPGKVIYPFTSYGWSEAPKQEDVLFRNATVWTNEKEGKMLNTDVLVQKGKIVKIGKNLSDERARIIDATGMHLTPGIIDEHSHIAMASTNETGQAITSEVGTGEVIENGIVAFTGGKITFVGKTADYTSGSNNSEVIDVKGKQVYPGLIFPNTSLGLVEIGGVDVTVDNRETGDLNPNVRSIVAYNTDSHVIPVVRSNGILIAQIVPTGTLLPGTSSVVQLDAWNWKDAIYKADNGLQMGWPRKSAGGGRGGSTLSQMAVAGESTYDKNVELLEKIFSDAVAYAVIEKPKDVNLRLEALKGLFAGDILDMLTNNIEYAFISGRNISLDNKHKQLYRRFEAKYENSK